MPDWLIIPLLMLAAMVLNIGVWVVKDMERSNADIEETERWLEQGENHGKN
jgi:hypothetical protein